MLVPYSNLILSNLDAQIIGMNEMKTSEHDVTEYDIKLPS